MVASDVLGTDCGGTVRASGVFSSPTLSTLTSCQGTTWNSRVPADCGVNSRAPIHDDGRVS